MKTLIITVGTRQVGWRSDDGTIYSFALDGDQFSSSHVSKLYELLGIERGCHSKGNKTFPWSVRDLGYRYFEYCNDWLDKDFSSVELLLDHCIIESLVEEGLDHIILWGTDQPETVSWNFRRLDTLWLAKLMDSKIRSVWPHLNVDVFDPIISVNDTPTIRKELEDFLLNFVLENRENQDDFTLYIQNKGAAPQISENLTICSAGLVRQCNVNIIVPKNPHTDIGNSNVEISRAIEFEKYPIGTFFWPLERLRVISALERGDFTEARLLLQPHRAQYDVLYKFSNCLAYFLNGETKQFKLLISSWLNSKAVAAVITREMKDNWILRLEQYSNDEHLKIWENFFINLTLLRRENYTNAFIVFAQSIERILFEQFRDDINSQGLETPSFKELIDAWVEIFRTSDNPIPEKWGCLLHNIREKRNSVVHTGEFMNIAKFCRIWRDAGFTIPNSLSYIDIWNLQIELIRKLYSGIWNPPNDLLLQSISDWGVQQLRAEISGSE